MAKDTNRLMRRMLRTFDLPEEVDPNVCKCTMLGGTDLMIENHRGILQYNDALIRIVTPEGILRIIGDHLELTEFGGERIYIRGGIGGWMFEERTPCGN